MNGVSELVLIGAGGHADDIAEFMPWVDRIAHHSEYRSGPAIIGINDPRLRASIAGELGIRDTAWVHPDARLYRGVVYGYGTHINYGVAAVRTTVGTHCTISPGVTICGDVTIGDRVLIGAGATICDKVEIEDDVTVGAGAVVTPGAWRIRPSGAEAGVMDPHVLRAGHTYVGVPAR